jgi:hypothetical protein
MKHTKKVSLVGFVGLPTIIIIRLIFDLILERDLLEGLFLSILSGLVFAFTWMVMYRFGIKRGWKILLPKKNGTNKSL